MLTDNEMRLLALAEGVPLCVDCHEPVRLIVKPLAQRVHPIKSWPKRCSWCENLLERLRFDQGLEEEWKFLNRRTEDELFDEV